MSQPIQKLLRQYGEHQNDYSLLEVGDRVNELIDYLFPTTHVEEKKVIHEAEVVNTAVSPTRSFAARSPSTADRVYLIKDGKRHWIKNPETLTKLGFSFSHVKGITNDEMNKYKPDEPIDMKEKKPLEVTKPKDAFDKYDI